MSHNETPADELLDNMDISPLVVALTDKWAVKQDLPLSVFRFPWDETKGLYYLKVFHGLHCLVGSSICNQLVILNGFTEINAESIHRL